MIKYYRLDPEFNNDTNMLVIYKGDTPLISIPFSINNNTTHQFTCDLCEFQGYCRLTMVFGTKKPFRDFCLVGPPHSYLDLKRIGVTSENFCKRLQANIVKKLPKSKKI